MTVVCVLTLTSLLATVCLLPVDIALVSITTNNATGLKKHWADPDTVDRILTQLKLVYYTLYSLDAAMCLLVVPFAYFWYIFPTHRCEILGHGTNHSGFRYEEWDIDTSVWQRIKGALKYSLYFVALVVILMTVGLFIPATNNAKGHFDLDYFKRLLLENSMHISLLNSWSLSTDACLSKKTGNVY